MSSRPGRTPSGRPARRPRQTCGSGSRAPRPRSPFPHRPCGRIPRCPPSPRWRRPAVAASPPQPGTLSRGSAAPW
eukprot:12164616-Alexandrium_andersonii.AAC.1